MKARPLPALLLLTAALLAAAPALAEPPGAAALPPPGALASMDPATRLTRAKDLFHRGVALLNAGDAEGALDFFLRSRAFVPSSSNTKNAAICLERLARDDEALSMYEELLRDFGAQLTSAEREALAAVLTALQKKVGSLQITANVDGQVFVDGRERGRLPLIGPIRVQGPRHAIQIVQEGYVPFEMVVDVGPGALVAVDARLRLLAGLGLLRVEAPSGLVTDVFLDGRRMGTTPWEGVATPGKHLVWTRRGNRGSAPVAMVTVQGQTALARIAESALGPPVRIEASPSTAEISLDGIALGQRAWEGRLPVGLHQVSVAEAGYVMASRSFMVTPVSAGEDDLFPSSASSASSWPVSSLRFALSIDPGHERWNRRADSPAFLRGRSFLGAFGGYAGSAGLHGSASLCSGACGAEPAAHGFLVGLRSGYRLGVGLAPELAGGYMAFGSTLSSVHGLFIGAGMSYRVAPVAWLGLLLRTTAGLLSAETGAGADIVPAQPFFVMPEIGADAALGELHLGLHLGLGFFPSEAPPIAREAAAGGNVRPYGPFLLWTPQIAAVYSFD